MKRLSLSVQTSSSSSPNKRYFDDVNSLKNRGKIKQMVNAYLCKDFSAQYESTPVNAQRHFLPFKEERDHLGKLRSSHILGGESPHSSMKTKSILILDNGKAELQEINTFPDSPTFTWSVKEASKMINHRRFDSEIAVLERNQADRYTDCSDSRTFTSLRKSHYQTFESLSPKTPFAQVRAFSPDISQQHSRYQTSSPMKTNSSIEVDSRDIPYYTRPNTSQTSSFKSVFKRSLISESKDKPPPVGYYEAKYPYVQTAKSITFKKATNSPLGKNFAADPKSVVPEFGNHACKYTSFVEKRGVEFTKQIARDKVSYLKDMISKLNKPKKKLLDPVLLREVREKYLQSPKSNDFGMPESRATPGDSQPLHQVPEKKKEIKRMVANLRVLAEELGKRDEDQL